MPPSLNNAYPTNRFTGGRFKSKELVSWEREFTEWSLVNLHEVVRARAYFSERRIDHIIMVQTDFFFEYNKILTKNGVPKKNDTTNRLKHLHDMVAKTLWIDDAWFFDGKFTKRPLLNPTNMIKEFCDVTLFWVKSPWCIGSDRS